MRKLAFETAMPLVSNYASCLVHNKSSCGDADKRDTRDLDASCLEQRQKENNSHFGGSLLGACLETMPLVKGKSKQDWDL